MKEKIVLVDLGLQDLQDASSSEDEDIFTYKGRQRAPSVVSKTSETSPESQTDEETAKEDDSDSKEETDDLGQLAEDLEGLHVGGAKPEGLSEQMEKLKIVSEAKDGEIKERKPMMNDFDYSDAALWGSNSSQPANDRSTTLLNGGTVLIPPVFSDNDLKVLEGICVAGTDLNPISISPPHQPNLLPPTPSPNPSHDWLLSPSSGYHSGVFGSPSSVASRSPMHEQLIPSTISQSSDDEDVRKEAIAEVRAWTDSQEMREVKKDEFIRASSKDSVEELFGVLQRLLCGDNRFTNRKFVRIYATICQILKRGKELKHFFLEENNLLSKVAEKNNPLLFRYIVETIYNEGLNPETMGEPNCNVFNVILNARNAQNEPLDCSQLLKTILSLKNRNNLPMFNLNDIDSDGLTLLHKVLIKMGSEPHLGMEYFKICLEFNPDFTYKTLRDSRTYMHHAILWGVPPEVMDAILEFCYTRQIYILDEIDIENKRPCDMLASHPSYSTEAVLLVLQKYNMMYLGPSWDPNFNSTRDDSEMSDLFNSGLLDDGYQVP